MKTTNESILKNVDFISLGKEIGSLKTDVILMVIDEKVWSIYKDKLTLIQKNVDKEVHVWIAPQGEETKRIIEFERCLESLLEKGVHRDSHLIAVGGGALSDFAGFIASSLVRGISWSVVPTTILSMVDASIGGKVGINSRFGKNLIGSFHKPTNVWINISFLESLPEEEINSGKGEIIKYALLSRQIFNLVNSKKSIEEIISACAKYKLDMTMKDPKEENSRRYLNLGHTMGHALEKAFSLKHGIAVYWGIVFFLKVFNERRFIEQVDILRDNINFDGEMPPWSATIVPVKKIFLYIEKDKKLKTKDVIELVLLEKIGRPKLISITLAELKTKVEKVFDEETRAQF